MWKKAKKIGFLAGNEGWFECRKFPSKFVYIAQLRVPCEGLSIEIKEHLIFSVTLVGTKRCPGFDSALLLKMHKICP